MCYTRRVLQSLRSGAQAPNGFQNRPFESTEPRRNPEFRPIYGHPYVLWFQVIVHHLKPPPICAGEVVGVYCCSMITTQTIVIDWRGLRLVGTLRLPNPDKAYPVVVMMQGSGPTDRTNDGYFLPIQEALLGRGIGTFGFDKPGCGESTGDWRDHGLVDRADQVEEALRTVRRHSMVLGDYVGLFGHSQGGWLAQMLAGRRSDLAFAVASAGPSITVAEQILYDCEHSMRANGCSESDIAEAVAFTGEVQEAAMEGLDFDAVYSRLFANVRSKPWYEYTTAETEGEWRHICTLLSEDYEPVETMRRIRCPFLAVYGGLDTLVPAWRSAHETGRELQRAGNSDAAVVVFPDGNHRIEQEPGTFVKGYLDLLSGWIARTVSV